MDLKKKVGKKFLISYVLEKRLIKVLCEIIQGTGVKVWTVWMFKTKYRRNEKSGREWLRFGMDGGAQMQLRASIDLISNKPSHN